MVLSGGRNQLALSPLCSRDWPACSFADVHNPGDESVQAEPALSMTCHCGRRGQPSGHSLLAPHLTVSKAGPLCEVEQVTPARPERGAFPFGL